jgi:hypothetical protein
MEMNALSRGKDISRADNRPNSSNNKRFRELLSL